MSDRFASPILEQMTTEYGWVGRTPRNNSNLSPEVQAEIERRIQQRGEEQGALLATVVVRVYEHSEEPQISFPRGSVLGPETDSLTIEEVVERAREQLAHWS